MNATWVLIVLRLVHVMSAIFWVGGILIVARFILPTVRAMGPAGMPVMVEIAQVRKLPMRLYVAGWLTVLSGLALYYRAASLSGPAWFASPPGRVFGLGGALGLVVILMGTFGNLPTTRRIGAIGKQLQTGPAAPELTAELQRLQLRLRRLTEIAAALLSLAAAAMAVARYT